MSKREDKAERKAERKAGKGEEEYEFPTPKFDERAFMRREVESARMTFVAVGFGLAAGVLARLADQLTGNFMTGWIPILALLFALTPIFRKMGYSEENTKAKAMFGNWSLVFFTGLAVWVVLYNPPFDAWWPR